MAELSFIVKAIDQASGTLKGVSGELDHMEGRASRLGGILKGGLMVGAGVAIAGIGALGAVLATSVAAASEAEDIQAQLNAVLESTGGIAGVTAEAINEQALALSKVTKFEDDSIVAAQSLLLTFTKVGKDVFPQATESILDMSQAMGMDLQSATVMVGKALNDPILGITAMSRAGIQFSEDQKETIKTMTEMGDVAGAQAIILKELETQFGGSAEAAGKTMSGQMEILKNQFGNVKEEIGGALMPTLTHLASYVGPILVDVFERFGNFLTNTLIPGISKVVTVVGNIFGGLLDDGWNLDDVLGYLTDKFPALGGVMDRFKSVGEGVSGFLGTLRETLVNVGTAIANQVKPTIETLVGIWNNQLRPAVETLASKLSETLIPALSRLWEWLGTVLPPVIETVGQFFREHILPALGDLATFLIEKVLPALVDLVTWLVDHIPPAIEGAAKFFRENLQPPLERVAKWLSENIPKAIEALKAAWVDAQPTIEIIKSIFTDIGTVLGVVWDWMSVKIPAAVDAVKSAFEAAQGAIQSVIGTIQTAIDNIRTAIDAIREFLGLGAGAGTGPTGGINTGPGGQPAAERPPGGWPVTGPGGTPTRGATSGAFGGWNFQINITAPGGNPQAVAAAAQTGVLAAARSMGIA